MPEEDAGAGELEHTKEVLDVILPAGDESPRVVEPGEEAFDFPAPLRATERPPILGGPSAAAIRRDHGDAVATLQELIEGVAVVATVAD
jgi:hypothetical protein